jgi:hypothetical protein
MIDEGMPKEGRLKFGVFADPLTDRPQFGIIANATMDIEEAEVFLTEMRRCLDILQPRRGPKRRERR